MRDGTALVAVTLIFPSGEAECAETMRGACTLSLREHTLKVCVCVCAASVLFAATYP